MIFQFEINEIFFFMLKIIIREKDQLFEIKRAQIFIFFLFFVSVTNILPLLG